MNLAIDRDILLWSVAIAHIVLAALCCSAMALDVPAINGAHPALKPLKFSISIALLLGTLAYVVPALTVSSTTRTLVTWILVGAVFVEMAIIVGQALRGVPSHFNTRTPFDTLLWNAMALAAVVLVGAVAAVAVLAVVRPVALPPLLTLAVRVGLVLVILTAVSGFAMGGRGSHTLGAADLRIPHFFALHGLQVLPLTALVLARLPLGERTQAAVLGVLILLWITVAVGTLVRSLSGQSLSLGTSSVLRGADKTGATPLRAHTELGLVDPTHVSDALADIDGVRGGALRLLVRGPASEQQ